MATPHEQHSARSGARVVGSGHQNGREPLAEAGVAHAGAAANDDPRTDSAKAPTEPAEEGAEVHRAPAAAPAEDNTDVRG